MKIRIVEICAPSGACKYQVQIGRQGFVFFNWAPNWCKGHELGSSFERYFHEECYVYLPEYKTLEEAEALVHEIKTSVAKEFDTRRQNQVVTVVKEMVI